MITLDNLLRPLLLPQHPSSLSLPTYNGGMTCRVLTALPVYNEAEHLPGVIAGR